MRGIFGPKMRKVTVGCKKLHIKELHNFYSLQNIIRRANQGVKNGLDI
jgi:hypothetical protein